MREMKNSGIAWMGEIPREWNISRIKYVADVDPSCDKTKIDGDSLITYTPMECIRRGNFVNKAACLNSVSSSLTAYEEGDIVMAKVTPCFENGNIAIMTGLHNGFGLGSSELFVFRPRSIITEYLFYWLQNYVFVQNAKATMTGTGGLKRVSPVFIKNCSIHMPPKEEQNKLVAFLDSKCTLVDTLIQNVQTQIEKLKAYKQSLITEVVTKGLDPTVPMKDSGVDWIGEIPEHWGTVKLQYCARIRSGITLGKQYPVGTETIERPYLRVANVQSGGVVLDNVKTVEVSMADDLQYRLSSGEVLMTEGGDRDKLGRGCVWQGQIEPCLHQNHIFALQPNDLLDSQFLAYMTASNVGRVYFDITAIKTTNLACTNSSKVLAFRFPLPDKGEQTELVACLDKKCAQIDRLIAIKQAKIEKLEQYKRSLIYEYVTGKKEVRL